MAIKNMVKSAGCPARAGIDLSLPTFVPNHRWLPRAGGDRPFAGGLS